MPDVRVVTDGHPLYGLDAVHHWDENGLADPSQEPGFIQTIHEQEIAFVKAWLADFKTPFN